MGNKGSQSCYMKNTEKGKKHIGQLAVLLCVLIVLCCFTAQKEGYHMDELLSFELSNAEFNPWIVPTQPTGRLAKFMREEIYGDNLVQTLSTLADTVRDVAANRGNSKLLQYKADVYPEPVWISRQQFHEYLTVNSKDCFNYFSVYFNVKDDNHPPLHIMLLHTMSSMFQGVLAPFMGCFINIVAVLGCCICFFRLGELLEEKAVISEGCGGPLGICAALLYGLSAGAIATTLLIRMYGLLTFFCVALFYLHVKKWLAEGFGRKNKGLAAAAVLGFLTQYFFLFYCFALAAVTAGLLCAKKRYKELKSYLRTMILSAVVGVVVFPFSIQDVLSSGRGEEALQNLSRGFSGYGTRLRAFGTILIKGSFGSLLAGLVILGCLAIGGVCLMIRKRKALKAAEEHKSGRSRKPEGERRSLWLMLLIPSACYFLLAARMSPYLVDRYIMPLFPFAAMLLALVLGKLCRVFGKKGKYLLLVPTGALCILNVCLYDGEYLFRGYDRQLEVAERHRELPCICLYDGTGYYYNLEEFTRYEKTLLLKLPELEQRQNTSDLTSAEQIVVLRKSNVEEAGVLEALKKYGWEVEVVLLGENDSVYEDTLYLCVRKSDR